MIDRQAAPSPAGPISRRIRVSTIPRAGLRLEIVADDGQRAALAKAHGLLAVDAFEATLLAETWQHDGVRLTGRVKARITQQCVVTLEPVEADIDEPVDLVLVPEIADDRIRATIGHEIVIDVDDPDDPDTFSGDGIDAGAIAEEFFALAIDPYPRGDGAEIEPSTDAAADDGNPSPFAELARLKRGGNA